MKHQILIDENYLSNSNAYYNDYMIKITKGIIKTENIIIYGSDILYLGGGILIYDTAVLEVLNGTTISNFKASGSNGTAIRVQPSELNSSKYNLNIDGATIKDNYNNNDAGAIFVNFGTKAIMKNVKIINNSASNGGAIEINGGQLDIYNSNISYNNARNKAGAINLYYMILNNILYSGTLNVYGKTIINNNTAKEGIIIINENCIFTMNNGINCKNVPWWNIQ